MPQLLDQRYLLRWAVVLVDQTGELKIVRRCGLFRPGECDQLIRLLSIQAEMVCHRIEQRTFLFLVLPVVGLRNLEQQRGNRQLECVLWIPCCFLVSRAPDGYQKNV